MKDKVVIGMSGGVDSSVAAHLLAKQGYDVIGITMQLAPYNEEFEETEGGCCSLSAVNDARRVADKLGIYYFVMNFREIFESKVINNFVEEYLKGRTPNPCVACNKYIKFDAFLEKAKTIGASYVATGHYAKIIRDEATGRYLLLRSKDDKKDQSYMLYNFTQYQLEHTLMPLGDYTKGRVREIAAELKLPVASKRDSQEICFVPDNNYPGFIEAKEPQKVRGGYFINRDGKILGKHRGIVHYTIGQRKGLGLSLGKPAFVTDIIPERDLVVIGEENEVFKDRLYAEDLNFIPFERLEGEIRVTAKVRYKAKDTPAIIAPYNKGVIVKFHEPQRAITKGQSVVFYQGDVVVGGGIIKEIL